MWLYSVLSRRYSVLLFLIILQVFILVSAEGTSPVQPNGSTPSTTPPNTGKNNEEPLPPSPLTSQNSTSPLGPQQDPPSQSTNSTTSVDPSGTLPNTELDAAYQELVKFLLTDEFDEENENTVLYQRVLPLNQEVARLDQNYLPFMMAVGEESTQKLLYAQKQMELEAQAALKNMIRSLKLLVFDEGIDWSNANKPSETRFGTPLPPSVYSTPFSIYRYLSSQFSLKALWTNLLQLYIIPSAAVIVLYGIGRWVEPIIFRHSLKTVATQFVLMIGTVFALNIFNGVYYTFVCFLSLFTNYLYSIVSYIPFSKLFTSFSYIFLQVGLHANGSILKGRFFMGIDYLLLQTIQSLFVYEQLPLSATFFADLLFKHMLLDFIVICPLISRFAFIFNYGTFIWTFYCLSYNLCVLYAPESIAYPYTHTFAKFNDIQKYLSPADMSITNKIIRQCLYSLLNFFASDYTRFYAPYTLQMAYAFSSSGVPKRNPVVSALRFLFLRPIQVALWLNVIACNVFYYLAAIGNQGLESLWSPYYTKSFSFRNVIMAWFNRRILPSEHIERKDLLLKKDSISSQIAAFFEKLLKFGEITETTAPKDISKSRLTQEEILDLSLGQDLAFLLDQEFIVLNNEMFSFEENPLRPYFLELNTDSMPHNNSTPPPLGNNPNASNVAKNLSAAHPVPPKKSLFSRMKGIFSKMA
jgi:hypothetical protein